MNCKEENIKFFNIWSYFYNFDPISIWLLYTQRKVLKQVNFNKEAAILDVGCGTGRELKFLSKKGLENLYGIDLSSLMIKKAEKLLKNKAILKAASVEKIPFNSDKFDFVINTEGFHHFPNPDLALKEMFRVLKKDGKLIISDINFYFDFVHWLFKKLEPGHVKIYSKKEFTKLFIKHKFKLIKQEKIGLFVILNIAKK